MARPLDTLPARPGAEESSGGSFATERRRFLKRQNAAALGRPQAHTRPGGSGRAGRRSPPSPRERHSPVGVLQHAEVLARPPLHVCNRAQTPVTAPLRSLPADPQLRPAVPGLYQRVKYRSAPPRAAAAAMAPA